LRKPLNNENPIEKTLVAPKKVQLSSMKNRKKTVDTS